MIYDYFWVTGPHDTVLEDADLFAITLRNDYVRVNDEDSIGWHSGKSVEIEDTWVWSTQNRLGIVRHGNSSEDIKAW